MRALALVLVALAGCSVPVEETQDCRNHGNQIYTGPDPSGTCEAIYTVCPDAGPEAATCVPMLIEQSACSVDYYDCDGNYEGTASSCVYGPPSGCCGTSVWNADAGTQEGLTGCAAHP